MIDAPRTSLTREHNAAEGNEARRRFARRLALLCAAAFVLRALFVVAFTDDRTLGSDAIFYTGAADAIAEGDGYQDGWGRTFYGGIPRATAQFPPLFPLLLAAPAWLFDDPRLWMHLLVCAVGTGTVALTGLLARRAFGDAVALVAAGLAAASPMLIGADTSLMPEGPYAFLVLLALLATARAVERPTVRSWSLVGVATGLAALTRSEGVFLLLAVVPPAVLALRGLSGRRRLGLVGASAMAVGVVMAPWVLRNAITLGEPVLLSYNSGTVLAGANCRTTFYGEGVGGWALRCLRLDEPVQGDAESAAEMRRKGMGYARRNAERLAVVVPVRLARTWGLWDPFDQMALEVKEGRVYGLQVAGWATTLVLAVLAVPPAFRHRGRPAVRPLLGVVLLVCVTSAVTYGNQRFRVAAEPVVAILAAVTIVELVRRRRTQDRSPVPAA